MIEKVNNVVIILHIVRDDFCLEPTGNVLLGEHWIVRCSMEESDGEESVVRLQLVVLLGVGSTLHKRDKDLDRFANSIHLRVWLKVGHSVLLLLRQTD